LSNLFRSHEGDTRKKRPIVWSFVHQVAFERLKNAITSAPVLVQPDPSKPYTIETDSSDVGNGMALYQEGEDGKLHPVAFDGRKLHGAELRYPTHEKELLAIKDALQKWHHYVENGHPITVITDHNSLKYMNTIQKPSKRLARWIDEFQ
jgi:RNase H-like domain found in reverse transcriptase